MKNFVLSLLAIGLLSLTTIGCGKGPDPKANPNFQEKTLMDPGAVKMGADAPKPAQSN
ncbi:MAG: hypothetical protein WCP62_06575 [Planctomycetota bacterium]|jgi:hypothetical protein